MISDKLTWDNIVKKEKLIFTNKSNFQVLYFPDLLTMTSFSKKNILNQVSISEGV